MHKVAVMGDYDSIYGFGALGLDTFPVTDVTESVQLLKKLAGGEYAIIYVTESLAEKISGEIEKYREQVTPAIILIPGVQGNTGAGVQSVKDSVEQAIGSDIVFGNK
ncbi:MAG: V-type ATP synthase subunit F [Eubacterium sp.]